MNTKCTPEELALKSFFVGPQAENADLLYAEIKLVLDHWIHWRKSYYPNDGEAISADDQSNPEFLNKIEKMRSETLSLLNHFSNEIPKFSPRYLGHMFSEISMPALIGHFIALLHNPNNVSKESSWIGSDIEKKAIRKLSDMVGYPSHSIGHFTSGGTIANFEAVIRAKTKRINYLLSHSDDGNAKLSFNDACYTTPSIMNPRHTQISDIELYQLIKQKYHFSFGGFTLIVPNSKHYSWTKASSIFSIGGNNLIPVELNKYGQMNPDDLKTKIDRSLSENKPIVCITSVLGTTELGTIDPIHEIQNTLDSYNKNYGYSFWHHVDAAYGGFFSCLRGDPIFKEKMMDDIDSVKYSTSITIDPHKLGYVPYSAGAFLCKNRTDYYQHETSAPYVNFDLKEDLGPYTLEGSRSATGATALYLTSECIGLDYHGYGRILQRTIAAAESLQVEAKKLKIPIQFVNTIGTNIVCFAVTKNSSCLSDVNLKTKVFLEKVMQNESSQNKNIFFLSKTHLSNNYSHLIENFCKESDLKKDADNLHLARLTIMNPFVSSIHPRTNYIQSCLEYINELCR